MFNEKEVCEYLVALCGIKNSKNRESLLGKIVKEIRRRPIVRREYSSTEIQKTIQHIVDEAVDFKEDKRYDYLKAQVTDLRREFLIELGTWNFIVSVENLKLQPRSFRIGDVTFFTFTPYQREKMGAIMWNALKDMSRYSTEWKKKYFKEQDQKVLSRMAGKTCAFVQVRGKQEKAHLMAYDKVENAIATLKLYRYLLYDEHQEYFHVTGKVIPHEIRVTLSYTDDGRVSTLLESVGFWFPFELDSKRIRFMKKAGFQKINKILKKEKRSKLEEKIINAIRLFGSACDVVIAKSRKERPLLGIPGFPLKEDVEPKTKFEAISLNERLVKLFIALESLVIFDTKEPLKENISERCAFLLVKSMRNKKQTYFKRKEVKNWIKTMYDFRSSYVHHGKYEIDSRMVRDLTRRVQECILTVVLLKDQMKLTTPQHLREWFERKKLS